MQRGRSEAPLCCRHRERGGVGGHRGGDTVPTERWRSGRELAVDSRHDLATIAGLEAVGGDPEEPEAVLLARVAGVPFPILRGMEAVVVGEVRRRLSLDAKLADAADAEVA